MKNKILNTVSNFLSWKSKKKIVVFESDDWGMTRMPSIESYKRLLNKGYPLKECPYSQNDALETNSDVEHLLNLLNQHKNEKNRQPIFTLNNVIANPDFLKIKESGYSTYFRESFIDTYKKTEKSEKVYSILKQGIDDGLVYPQYHATEHLSINRWMNALQKGDKIAIDAFNEGMYTIYSGVPTTCHKEFLDTFGLQHNQEIATFESIINYGLNYFEKAWGFKSKSFIAPCYIWPTFIEKFLHDNGVEYIQGTRVQRNAVNDKRIITKKYHFTGQTNNFSQVYLVRNVTFEPSLYSNSVNSALKEIEFAFKFNSPAIISSHRVNYIGRLNEKNRKNGLEKLNSLLVQILKKWPNVEFMTTTELGKLISEK